MSHASTITYYINIAAEGRLNGECLTELESAIEGLVDEAVGPALQRIAVLEKLLERGERAAIQAANVASCLANGIQPD